MPKKAKSQVKESKQQKTEMSEDELSELFQKSLKEHAINDEEAEEKIDRNIAVESLEFHNFISPGAGVEVGTPVLERIAGSQVPRPIFVGGIPQQATESNGAGGNGDDFKYMPSVNQPGEANYTGSTHIDTETERVDFSRVGRERSELRGWESWGASERLSVREQGFSSGGIEQTGIVRSFDTSVAGRSKEREEIKYKKYNPKKLPSGR